jgi:ATP/maltotriose-dependent transcriptional regulator MalT
MAVVIRWPLVGRRDDLDAFAAALDEPGRRGFCIYGPAGVGKTRLAEECARLAEDHGRRVLRVTTERSNHAVPLGAIAHLLPPGALRELGASDVSDDVVRGRLLDAARRSLAEISDGAKAPILLVDDIQRLDGASLGLVDRLILDGSVFGIATVLTGEDVPAAVTRWWSDELVVRLDLADLDAVGVDTLLHVVLEGPLDADTSAQLWRASRGNLLALRELVLGAKARQVLVSHDGVWRLTGPLGATTRLRELVEARIGGLNATSRALLELLSLCQPVGLGQLEARFGLAALETLEQNGLITVKFDGRRATVTLSHPLHGEVLRAAIRPLAARSLLLAQADAVEAVGARRREDPLRIATWRLEATGTADPDLLLRAARLARFSRDHRKAADLARVALVARPSAAAGLVLGESLYDLSSYEEAEAVLAAATATAGTDDELVRIATVRRRNLFWGCRRDEEALAVARDAAAKVVSTPAHNELVTGEAEVLAYGGHPVDALVLLERVDVTVPRVRVLAAIARAAALATTGRTAEAIAVSSEGYEHHLGLGDELAIAPPGTHMVNQTWALVEAGRLAEAEALGHRWVDLAARVRMPLGVTWFCLHLARCALAQGKPATARQWGERATMNAEAWRFEGLRPMAYAVLAYAHALLGNATESAARAHRIDASRSGYGFLGPELCLGRAWALVASGDVAAARDVLLAAAESAEQTQHIPVAAWLLHDAVRLGAERAASARLADLVARTDSRLVAVRSEHAAALIDDDPVRLTTAADQFEAIGALLLAAEAAIAAAEAWKRRREQRRAAGLLLRANQLSAHCENATTPRLVGGDAVVPLTTRERDVATLAAAGHSSRVIADRLYLSVRTVDNHLARIYEKLGVSGRRDLADLLRGGGQ